MKLTLLLVGKTTSNELDKLIDGYRQRLTHYIPFDIVVIPELKNTKSLTREQQKEQEGQLILKAVPASADLVLLDERGQEFRSVEFAAYLQKKMSTGRDIVFAVGGPYGFSKAVYKRANGQISLSRLTFSHQMIRLLFIEQVYRACTIIRGEPYHHE